LSEADAVKIARDWNVPASGKEYVTRFLVAKTFVRALSGPSSNLVWDRPGFGSFDGGGVCTGHPEACWL
jgi:hypothetical protein